MPVYTYQCEECGVQFDAKQGFSDAPITVCPECSGPTHKVIGPVGVIFRGKGFYVTDNRSKSSTMPPSTKKDGESSSASTDSPAAESKDSAKSSGESKSD